MTAITSTSAVSGLQAASNRLVASAARTMAGSADLPAEAVEQVAAKHAFSASAAVIKTEDKMFKRLLDITV